MICQRCATVASPTRYYLCRSHGLRHPKSKLPAGLLLQGGRDEGDRGLSPYPPLVYFENFQGRDKRC